MYFPENDFGVRDVDGPAREGARMLTALEAAQEDLDKIVGTAKSRSGHVEASVNPEGRVLNVSFGPRALRMGSEDLAEEVMATLDLAGADAQRQADALLRDTLPGYDLEQAAADLRRVIGDWR
ncbi:YbaB/EbfC family nucleoid-associated protein [Nonomuraea sp. NPDC048901]|uniref:YbaB/EbfC family nucleoid-associated protein n=1 Tax=unclassified Nonomuraea TaxID=2593643 RepID=UPI0033FCF576